MPPDVPKRPAGATIIDIARLAGVSPSTASRVLRGADYPVSDMLRKRILAVADDVGYVPNLQARWFRGGGSGYLGLIVGSISDPFFGAIAEAVTQRARFWAMSAIVTNMQRDPILELELCRSLWEHRVTGLIISGGSFDQFTHAKELDDLLKRMVRSGIEVVSLAERGLSIPTIAVDNREIGRMIVERVVGLGHRHVGVVIGAPSTILNRERSAAIVDTLTAAGCRVVIEHADPTSAAGGQAAERVLAAMPDVTAIMAGGDMQAIGIMQYLHDKGLRVPEDISITGIGNTPHSQFLRPRLTTVEVAISAAGAAAVDRIAHAMRGDDDTTDVVLKPYIIAGDSSGPVRGG